MGAGRARLAIHIPHVTTATTFAVVLAIVGVGASDGGAGSGIFGHGLRRCQEGKGGEEGEEGQLHCVGRFGRLVKQV